MPLKALKFRPGVNKEVTRYSAEGGWVDADKVRFRRGYPETIGGWRRMINTPIKGTCRDLTEWATLGGLPLYGIGTNLKYYVSRGTDLFDITPLRSTTAAGDVTFAASSGSALLNVTDVGHGARAGDFVLFSGATALGGAVTAAMLNTEFEITQVLSPDVYRVTLPVNATAGDTGNGGGAVVARYPLASGLDVPQAITGWGAGAWGGGAFGVGEPGSTSMRFWSHANYGEDLIFGVRGGPLYYYDVSAGITVSNRGTLVTGSDVPVVHNELLVSDVSRFVIAFGCNELGSPGMDPMLVRWSAQENYTMWTPAITNQAGGQRLSYGSKIVAARQSRQEILIWTDTALYSMQYLGPPYVWGFQLLGENVSIMSRSAVTLARNVAYWMGQDKFYTYDGGVRPLPCDLLRFVFTDLNYEQRDIVVCGTNEAFSEVWWHYPSAGSLTNNRYVVFNYEEGIWTHGTLTRSAWMDSRLRGNPIAVSGQYVLDHEVGVDDGEGDTLQPLRARLDSAPVDIDDGERFAFVWRVLPDVTFDRSTSGSPSLQMTLLPFKNSGAGYTAPMSVGGTETAEVTRVATVPVERFTEQVNIRVRGRQIALRLESTDVGVAWQLGTPRVDMKPDGRR